MNILERNIQSLSRIGADKNGAITRQSGSKELDQARGAGALQISDAGLRVTFDQFSNIIGHMPGADNTLPPIVTGSHVDTVLMGGKYDGVLGVLAGIEVARELKGQLRHPFEEVVFWDEEVTMSGSVGYSRAKDDIAAFIELHVEQGPVLDSKGVDIGVVTGIVGQRRCHFTVKGQANHAGTTPMEMRDDALVKAAELISYVNQGARNYEGLVATVGKLDVSPNLFSIIPGQVDLTLQVRDLDADNLDEFVGDVVSQFDFDYEPEHSSEPVRCGRQVMDTIARSAEELGLTSMEMPSRASHDAQNFGKWPMGMIFVPSIGGVSHSKDELTTSEQCYGSMALSHTIRTLDGELNGTQ